MIQQKTSSDEPSSVNADSGLSEIVASYHAAVKALHEYRMARHKSGQLVRVNDARFKGIGMVCAYSSEIPPDKLPVRLENNNVWWYDLTSIVGTVPSSEVPRSVRRLKLRWYGYRLEAIA